MSELELAYQECAQEWAQGPPIEDIINWLVEDGHDAIILDQLDEDTIRNLYYDGPSAMYDYGDLGGLSDEPGHDYACGPQWA